MVFKILGDFKNVTLVNNVCTIGVDKTNRVIFITENNLKIIKTFKNIYQANRFVNAIYERIEAQQFRGTPMIDTIKIELDVRKENSNW